ncbi:Protein of unknown function [Sphingomonas guangdongensis]|uniref:DUF1861 family protein n=1 Tax=Sphingomonas guangdongensis TaxID=1141890 RepID=A0A285R5R3_9SPHN|nr:DUF1861 family protein [Sphingomonas guangdongensis]SOB87692.1 Protein of unknown function [Sphingomonas guangdongensis]
MTRESIPRVETLFDAWSATAEPTPPTGKLHFAGVGDRDVYNITAPFWSAGRRVIGGRVEARDSEHSTVIFFEEDGERWLPIADAPRFALQDPFVTQIGDELVFGGVEVDFTPAEPVWHTVFYRGRDLFELRPFFAGPVGMKDIRLCALADGRVAVFTRPRGAKGGRGTIGYTEVDTLDALSIAAIEAAPMLEGMFHPLDWGGANEAHLLSTGEIGVIAHAAFFDQDILYGMRRYYAVAFVFDPAARAWRDYRIIAARGQFAPGAAKRPDLIDVVFSSGIEQAAGSTRLYAGTSDAEAQWVEIDYPFDAPLARGLSRAAAQPTDVRLRA